MQSVRVGGEGGGGGGELSERSEVSLRLGANSCHHAQLLKCMQ